jgi:hypothetical protein
MISKERLLAICAQSMKVKGLQNEVYVERFKKELKEIDNQSEYDYFLNMYERKVRFPVNENNLLISHLLDLCPAPNMEVPQLFIYGDFPDIDTDFLPEVRTYLKEQWAKQEFGAENTCAIGNYTTFGIKSALIDSARVLGKDRKEILDITTQLSAKDDEGKSLTFDKAMELFPKLKEYCENNSDVADAARRLLNRNRGMGVHAGGLIIANQRIDNLVPLVRGEDDAGNTIPVSAFVEGLHGTDLGPLGLVKYDMLVVMDLQRIADCCTLIKQRHGLKSICAAPGQEDVDWSDTSYLNEPKCLEGDLKCIFQFDSDGIRELCRKGGVDSFEDLIAYSAIYRPGPLGMEMDGVYIKRKRGEETYELHPLLQPILGKTYGVLVYQEQVMRVLNVVGDISLTFCEKVRKAISKKKVNEFMPYKTMFVENGQKRLGWTKDEVENLWKQIEQFAEYGFNRSISAETTITYDQGAKRIDQFVAGDFVYAVDANGNTVLTEVIALHDHGDIEGYEVTFDDGGVVVCSANHKFLTKKGQLSLREIVGGNYIILCDSDFVQKDIHAETKRKWLDSQVRNCVGESAGAASTRDGLFDMSKSVFYNRETSGSLRVVISQQKGQKEPSADVRDVSFAGMEASTGNWSASNAVLCDQMWDSSSDHQRSELASKNLPELSCSETRKHSNSEFGVQSFAIQASGIVCGGENDFGTSGNCSTKDGEVACLARSEPREVSPKFEEREKSSKTIKDGSVASFGIELAGSEYSMPEHIETSRFGFREYLDRSGRIFPFLSANNIECSQDEVFEDQSGPGCHAERRSYKEEEHHLDTFEYGMFCQQHRSDEDRMVPATSGHAGIADARRLVSRKIVRVVPVGKRRMYDIEVACSTHNFLLSNGVITSNSHSCAYGYISARLLWLKTHYPLEFFTVTLRCEKDFDKIKIYKREASKAGIEVKKLDLNKSGWTFDIVGNDIYIGFSNVKGIGEEVGKQIVASQPYGSFDEFLRKFGTDANVLKPLISLGVFGEVPRPNLYEFYEYYKSTIKKREDRDKRAIKTRQGIVDEFRYTLPEAAKDQADSILEKAIGMSEEDAEIFITAEAGEDGLKSYNKYRKNTLLLKKKQEEDGDVKYSNYVYLGKDKESELYNILSGIPSMAEEQYYGFAWVHEMEYSSDYEGGRNLDRFNDENQAGTAVMAVECVVKRAVQEKKSKSNNVYYSIGIEDENNKFGTVIIWQEDYERFKEELSYWDEAKKRGHFLLMRLERPSGGFKTYKFDSPPKAIRHKHVPKDKKDDARLTVMAEPVPRKG